MTILGIILFILVVALYAWWILYTKHQTGVLAKESGGKQVFNIRVKGSYQPNTIRAKLGLPLQINFVREESTECSRFVVFSDFQIRKELPENETVSIEIIPKEKGEFTFTCDMGMYQGKLIIE